MFVLDTGSTTSASFRVKDDTKGEEKEVEGETAVISLEHVPVAQYPLLTVKIERETARVWRGHPRGIYFSFHPFHFSPSPPFPPLPSPFF